MRHYFQHSPALIMIIGLAVAILVFASPVAAINITVTGNIQDWAFTPGTTNENATTLKLNVSTESSSWHVNVKDALDNGKHGSSAGKLLEYNASTGWVNAGSVISSKMIVVGETVQNVQGSTATLGSSAQVIETGNAAAFNKQMAITLRQLITYTDRRLTNGNTYRVVITFTGVES
jgi:hypothetical protein